MSENNSEKIEELYMRIKHLEICLAKEALKQKYSGLDTQIQRLKTRIAELEKEKN